MTIKEQGNASSQDRKTCEDMVDMQGKAGTGGTT